MRPDDFAAMPLRALIERNARVDWAAVQDIVYGCANQAGEDNRNVARKSLLLSGLPLEIAATTVNRLCGSGMDALGIAARAIKTGEAGLMIAGGTESMTRDAGDRGNCRCRPQGRLRRPRRPRVNRQRRRHRARPSARHERCGLVTTATTSCIGGRDALCTMCIGAGQGVAAVIERV